MTTQKILEPMALAMCDAGGFAPGLTSRAMETRLKEMAAAIRMAESLGWKLVPIEPTQEQIDACAPSQTTAKNFYAAMIAKAPRPI